MADARAPLSCASAYIALLLACLAPSAFAQNSITRGGVTVHYGAVATTSLDAAVARGYAITRSSTRALLSIVVLRAGADAMPVASQATVTATVTNAAGRSEALALREVVDGASISYLAEPRIAARDTLEFALLVTPRGEATPIEIRFEQAFFPESPN